VLPGWGERGRASVGKVNGAAMGKQSRGASPHELGPCRRCSYAQSSQWRVEEEEADGWGPPSATNRERWRGSARGPACGRVSRPASAQCCFFSFFFKINFVWNYIFKSEQFQK
jgi:hypothetical protein